MANLISGPNVVLRDRLPSDADRYVDWMDHGEWLEYDAPWENTSGPLTLQRREELRKGFIESCEGEQPCPRRRAIIADRDDRPLGWVNTYRQDDAPGTLYVGIDICEDDCLNRGLGTEALKLWIEYLFANADIERIGLETWSFNPRMKRAAEKAGLVLANVKHQEMEWQGELLDMLQYYVLRSEWQASTRGARHGRRAHSVPAQSVNKWLVELAFAVPIVAGLVCLFYNWYAVRDRYFIFLYYHEMGQDFDTSPFGWVTAGRYRMSALVASGAVMVPYIVVNLVLGRAVKRYRAPVWWRIWIFCSVPLLVAVPAITMTVNNPVLSPGYASQVTAVMLVGLALALFLGRMAAERPLAYLLALLDGGALAILLVSLAGLERYPDWLARGRVIYLVMLLVVVGAGIALSLAMTAVYSLWRRAEPPLAMTVLVAGLDVAYLLLPLVHHLFVSTDEGTWLDPGFFTYIPSADNYFARSAWVQIGVWVTVATMALGTHRLRVWISQRRKAGRRSVQL